MWAFKLKNIKQLNVIKLHDWERKSILLLTEGTYFTLQEEITLFCQSLSSPFHINRITYTLHSKCRYFSRTITLPSTILQFPAVGRFFFADWMMWKWWQPAPHKNGSISYFWVAYRVSIYRMVQAFSPLGMCWICIIESLSELIYGMQECLWESQWSFTGSLFVSCQLNY